jgi:broad specificity polyphosphatase/5'/3'-nucleotidase SurE
VTLVGHLERAPERTVLNLNVPNLPLGGIRGIRRARLATTGLIRAAGARDGDPKVTLDLGFREPADDEESDEALTGLGWAVVTPLASVTEDHRPEVADVLGEALVEVSQRLGRGAVQ